MRTLLTYGWDDKRAKDWTRRGSSPLIPARVVSDHGKQYTVATPNEVSAQLAGSLMHKLTSTEMPKIGDWVAIEQDNHHTAIIHEILPRKSEIVRGHTGRVLDKQIVAANVDLAFIMQPLDHDFSSERLERYIFQLTSHQIQCVILLNKSDKAQDLASKQAQLTHLGVDTITMSATNDADLTPIEHYLTPGRTAVILGSSGAGKSTLINRLLGAEIQATGTIRAKDSKGRHTTVHRELFVLPGGGLIIDTPGVRELQLWGETADLELLFPEIYQAFRSCHYKNCSHTSENGCAIIDGLADNTIDARRYRIYQGFKQELESLEAKRAFISERRSQQTRESVKRRRLRSLRAAQDADLRNE